MGSRRGLALQNRQHFVVGEAPLRMDDGGIKLRVQHPPVVGNEKFHAFGQAVHVRLERAQFVAQRLRQHRDDAVHQVGRVAALARLVVQRRAGLHVMRHVRDVDPQLPLLRRNALQADRVVKILRVVGINGDDRGDGGNPRGPPPSCGVNRRADGVRLVQHGLGKMQRQIVLAQHRQHVHAFLVRRAEDFDDFAFGIGVARFPFAQFDHHLVADARGPAHVARFRHINVVRNARIIGNDEEKLFVPVATCRRSACAAVPECEPPCRFPPRPRRDASPGPDIAPHQHAVFVQGRGGRAFRDDDFLEAGIVRLEKAVALAVHADAARNQVRLARQDVAVALDAGDPARLLQFAEHALQLLLAMRRQPEQPEQFRHIGRDIIFLVQQTDDLVFH